MYLDPVDAVKTRCESVVGDILLLWLFHLLLLLLVDELVFHRPLDLLLSLLVLHVEVALFLNLRDRERLQLRSQPEEIVDDAARGIVLHEPSFVLLRSNSALYFGWVVG